MDDLQGPDRGDLARACRLFKLTPTPGQSQKQLLFPFLTHSPNQAECFKILCLSLSLHRGQNQKLPGGSLAYLPPIHS